ncbi:MAG TPA: PIN domain-containing protein [Thermomicrobiales bacterium]
MRVMLDTNVVLDHLLRRVPWADDATAIWHTSIAGEFEAFVSAITPVNVFYVARKGVGALLARRITAPLLATAGICAVDHAVLQAAQALAFKDYEDAVQHASASAARMDVLVTRDLPGYANATLPVLAPADFLRQLRSATP